jgi:hypothetical protein
MNKFLTSIVINGLCLPLGAAWGEEISGSAAGLLSIGRATSRHAVSWGDTEAALKKAFPVLDPVPVTERGDSIWRWIAHLNDWGCSFIVALTSDHQRDSLAQFWFQYRSGPIDICTSRLKAVLIDLYGPPQGTTQTWWQSSTTCFNLGFNPSQLYLQVGDKRQGDACGYEDQVVVTEPAASTK